MQSLTIQQLFGANATQDSQFLYIQKSDLPKLIPSINNRADSLLTALLLQVWDEFEGLLVDELGELIVDEMGVSLGYDQQELYEKLNLRFWRQQFVGGKILKTFVADIFIKPAISYNTATNPDQVVY